MMFEGGEIIRERIKRYQIDCDYRPGGLFVAMNDKQLATLEEQKENWERYGNKQLELLDANAIRREVAQRSLHWCAAGSQRWAYSPAKPRHW
ncbi:gamma-glutamylputrescine oxidoreductase [Escherichia coli]|uniref:Gamma-glutamylputrescine oxidoreductase n=1 Tax=Escherichia coli TaxID=562 RepID=A0A2X1J0L7_ECOLX|nr:gamma-glutamylputrescine oxidoreductase [Escherichia coli]